MDVGVKGVGRPVNPGPAIVVMIGEDILDADESGGGHDDGGGKPGILVGYDRLEPGYKLDAADDAMTGG